MVKYFIMIRSQKVTSPVSANIQHQRQSTHLLQSDSLIQPNHDVIGLPKQKRLNAPHDMRVFKSFLNQSALKSQLMDEHGSQSTLS